MESKQRVTVVVVRGPGHATGIVGRVGRGPTLGTARGVENGNVRGTGKGKLVTEMWF